MRSSLEDKVQILQEVDIIVRLTISAISASSDLARFFDRVYRRIFADVIVYIFPH